ncbi:cysteine-rich protein 3-like [Mustelus asterias]
MALGMRYFNCMNRLDAGAVPLMKRRHDGKPYCHKPCYATLFGPKGVNIGDGGSYIYQIDSLAEPPVNALMQNLPVSPSDPSRSSAPAAAQSALVKPPPPVRTAIPAPRAQSRAPTYTTIFAGETAHCPGCGKVVYFAEKVTSLGRNWHRPCLRCERCRKTLIAGNHAEHEGKPYCQIPCYGILFGPKGVNIGNVGCYIYND